MSKTIPTMSQVHENLGGLDGTVHHYGFGQWSLKVDQDVDKNISEHNKQLISHLQDLCTGNLPIIFKNLNGNPPSLPGSTTMQDALDTAGAFTYNELNSLAKDHPDTITPDMLDTLRLLSGLKHQGCSAADATVAIQRYNQLSDKDKSWVGGVFDSDEGASRDEYATPHVTNPDAKKKDRKETWTVQEDLHVDLSSKQHRLALFLTKADSNQLGNMKDFTNLTNLSADEQAHATLLNSSLDKLSDDDKNTISGIIQGLARTSVTPAAASGTGSTGAASGTAAASTSATSNSATSASSGAANAPDPSVVKTSLNLKDMQSLDLGTLFALVMSDRSSALDREVRSYSSDVEAKNSQLGSYQNLMTKMRTLQNSDPDGKSNISGEYFTKSDGTSVKITDYLHEAGILPESDDGSDLDSTTFNNMMTSLKSKTDTLTSDSQEAFTKLQAQMDKYNQAISAETNFETKWHNMIMSVVANLKS